MNPPPPATPPTGIGERVAMVSRAYVEGRLSRELYERNPATVCEAAPREPAPREDKAWSFTDCSSFVVMESMEVRDALAFDKNFAEAAFATHPWPGPRRHRAARDVSLCIPDGSRFTD